MIEAGTTVDGYRVERMIGRGGMGVVYEAVETSINRRVALKVLRPELADDPEFVERFRREARLQASLEHPHVLEVYDAGESDAGLFLAMRLVSGRTLLDLLREHELDAERALELLDQVTGALDVAHDANLVHRDVKPQNVLIDDERAFLADFGLTSGGTETTVATSRPMLGSVAYVAPEIVRGEEPTPASDRYSVAATLFHCLTGDVVFPRGSDAAVLYAHATEAPPRVRERRRELPDALDGALGPALAKQPGERPPTARSIVRAARDALGSGVGSLASPQLGSLLSAVSCRRRRSRSAVRASRCGRRCSSAEPRSGRGSRSRWAAGTRRREATPRPASRCRRSRPGQRPWAATSLPRSSPWTAGASRRRRTRRRARSFRPGSPTARCSRRPTA
jgi:serine/threonine-protein kinase